VWDKDKITKDDLVGEGYVDLLSCQPGHTSRSVNLTYKGRNAGTLFLSIFVEGAGQGMGRGSGMGMSGSSGVILL
jgi:hypothetical protein